ncbi:helix-turn-helix transcriptional regulator [Rufibacter glacialis]|uniref:Helix-turn-helix transcriptional regulator n=1 Tax=Rufibacter glacialis TaxID=1259555 RepID=A0A5M8QFM6_9BACT|nr:helix-turn-helix transcriptional regulator [Rufibacter glacialis]
MKNIRFHKTVCGVELLLNVGAGHELLEINPEFNAQDSGVYTTDSFEIYFFKKAGGHVILNQRKIEIRDNMVLFMSPFQKRHWKLEAEPADYTFLIFQEDFLNDFFADKLFTYRLLYFYQLDHALDLPLQAREMESFCEKLTEIKGELVQPKLDSEHLVRSLLYYLLLKLNREYATQNQLPLEKPENHYAYQFKKLIEQHVKEMQRVNEYAALLGISRVTLNKAVQAQFNVTAAHLLKQRLVFEIKNYLIHAELTVHEIAEALHFSEPNHLMRFFKAQTGFTTSQFLADYQNGTKA